MSGELFSNLETPWPILVSSEADSRKDYFDYPHSDCFFTVDHIKDNEQIILEIDAVIQDPELEQLITEDKLKYQIILRSAVTSFRKSFDWDGQQHIKISRRNVRDNLEIFLFCIATEDLEVFSPSTLTDDLNGSNFFLQKNGLAIYLGAHEVTLDDPDSKSLQLQECFGIRKKDDLTGFEFNFDDSDDTRFFVDISPNAYELVGALNDEQKPLIALASFIMPALVAFITQKSDDPPLVEAQDKYWAKQLIVKFKKIEMSDFKTMAEDPNYALSALGQIFGAQYETFFDALIMDVEDQ